MKVGKDIQFNVIFRPEKEGGFTVVVPSLPGCVTYGKDIKEAKKRAIEAIDIYLISARKHGEKIFSDEENFVGLISVKSKAYA